MNLGRRKDCLEEKEDFMQMLEAVLNMAHYPMRKSIEK